MTCPLEAVEDELQTAGRPYSRWSFPSFMYGLYRFSVGVLVPGLEAVYSINDATAGVVVSASVGAVGLGVIGSGVLGPAIWRREGDTWGVPALLSLAMGVILISNSLVFFFVAVPPCLLRQRADDHPVVRAGGRLVSAEQGLRGELRHLGLQLCWVFRASASGLPVDGVWVGRPVRCIWQ